MIRPDTRKPERYRITSYDFEWRSIPLGSRVKQLEITHCGAYDERGYRHYESCAQFLRGELITENCKRRFYAHFGGASDMVFLLRELCKLPDHYVVRGVFSGSAAIMVTVLDTSTNREWQFLDSFWTMRVGLAEIGNWLGMSKGDIKHDDSASWQEMRDYNEQDCRILYTALHRFQDVILSEGGEMGITAASTAMRTFLKCYLKKPIENRKRLNFVGRQAYTASRVEVVRKSCKKAGYYDLNSSFPFSMTFACPGNGRRWKGNGGDLTHKVPSSGLWIADCQVNTPDSVYFPTLPFRAKTGRVFFPTGRMRCYITSEDYAAGDFAIEKVHSVTTFEDRDDLRAFAERFYMLRQAGGFEGKTFKIVLNSLYGKFAERPEKRILLVRPAFEETEGAEMLSPGVYVKDISRNIPHQYVPISTFITARSRRLLLEYMREAQSKGEVYYCDTDSILTSAELPTSKELGGLKLEDIAIDEGVFRGPKLYALRDAEGHEHVRAKGFSRIVGGDEDQTRIDYATFARLSAGEPVQIERMLRIRELMRNEGADYLPRQVVVEKRLGEVRSKRCHLENGDSRPWHVKEIWDE